MQNLEAAAQGLPKPHRFKATAGAAPAAAPAAPRRAAARPCARPGWLVWRGRAAGKLRPEGFGTLAIVCRAGTVPCASCGGVAWDYSWLPNPKVRRAARCQPTGPPPPGPHASPARDARAYHAHASPVQAAPAHHTGWPGPTCPGRPPRRRWCLEWSGPRGSRRWRGCSGSGARRAPRAAARMRPVRRVQELGVRAPWGRVDTARLPRRSVPQEPVVGRARRAQRRASLRRARAAQPAAGGCGAALATAAAHRRSGTRQVRTG
jgi:hypothetical protein